MSYKEVVKYLNDESKENFVNEFLESEEIDPATSMSYAGIVDLLNEFYDRVKEISW